MSIPEIKYPIGTTVKAEVFNSRLQKTIVEGIVVNITFGFTDWYYKVQYYDNGLKHSLLSDKYIIGSKELNNDTDR